MVGVSEFLARVFWVGYLGFGESGSGLAASGYGVAVDVLVFYIFFFKGFLDRLL